MPARWEVAPSATHCFDNTAAFRWSLALRLPPHGSAKEKCVPPRGPAGPGRSISCGKCHACRGCSSLHRGMRRCKTKPGAGFLRKEENGAAQTTFQLTVQSALGWFCLQSLSQAANLIRANKTQIPGFRSAAPKSCREPKNHPSSQSLRGGWIRFL